MNKAIQLIGWDDISVKPVAVLSLSSRALKVYQYLIMKGQKADSAWPAIDEMVTELDAFCVEESWSEPTIKRCLQELQEKHFIYRSRRVRMSSVTHLFKDPEECERFSLQLTDDPTVSSQVIRQSTTTISQEETKTSKLVKLHERAFGYSPLFYDLGLLAELGDEYELGFIEAAFKEAVRLNKRSMAYVESVCRSAKQAGRAPGQREGKGSGKAQEDRASVAGYKVLR